LTDRHASAGIARALRHRPAGGVGIARALRHRPAGGVGIPLR
jgi:hypothetical protein